MQSFKHRSDDELIVVVPGTIGAKTHSGRARPFSPRPLLTSSNARPTSRKLDLVLEARVWRHGHSLMFYPQFWSRSSYISFDAARRAHSNADVPCLLVVLASAPASINTLAAATGSFFLLGP